MIEKIIESFLNHKQAQGYSPLTVENYMSDLNIFSDFLFHLLQKDDFTIELLQQVDDNILDKYLKRYPNLYTKSRKLASVKSFYKYLEDKELVKNTHVKKYQCKKPPEISPIKRSDFYTNEQIDRMELECDNTKYPLRDKLILNLIRTTGMRPREVANISIKHMNLEECKGKVKRKGGVERPFRFSEKTRDLLREYISKNKDEIRKGNGKLFSLNYSGIYGVIRLLGQKCGIHTYPKMFRHIWASEGREKDMDILLMEELGGWKSSKMLKRYGQISEEKEKSEYNKVWGGK